MRALPLLVVIALAPSTLAQDPRIRPLIERYQTDKALLERRYELVFSNTFAQRMQRFFHETLDGLAALPFEDLTKDDQVDWLLFRNAIQRELARRTRTAKQDDAIGELVPFAEAIVELVEKRRGVEPIEPKKLAAQLSQLAPTIEKLTASLGSVDLDSKTGNHAARRVSALSRALREWYRFYKGYDPMFSWWVKSPYTDVEEALGDYAQAIRAKQRGGGSFRGEPIGRAALLDELAFEMIPYSPEELVRIAQKEFAWCDKEMLRASRDLGFGEEWKKALDSVKNRHVEPGEQPRMIRELAWEAIDYIDEHELITVPELCKESWRMTMMSPERQKTSPYFLGGETIQVSFPTDAMAHIDKLMSMRGNNRHFARATVHHELIPGHHLQGFMTDRHRTYRRLFRTPFWMEGWALYWEMTLWDRDFQQSAADRVGMLFWRMHRCARIVFSLSYHLGEMTEQECIDFLVERVGHERNNATAEVRRSVVGGYGPLYQAAYMLGALQLRALRREVVDSGKLPERDFHDQVLRANSIPIEMVRALVIDQKLTRDFRSSWRFYGDV